MVDAIAYAERDDSREAVNVVTGLRNEITLFPINSVWFRWVVGNDIQVSVFLFPALDI